MLVDYSTEELSTEVPPVPHPYRSVPPPYASTGSGGSGGVGASAMPAPRVPSQGRLLQLGKTTGMLTDVWPLVWFVCVVLADLCDLMSNLVVDFMPLQVIAPLMRRDPIIMTPPPLQ